MATPKHIVAGSLFTVILIALGFALGIWAQDRIKSPPSALTDNSSASTKPNTNTSTYQISAPHRGRINITKSFPFTPKSNLVMIVLPAADVEGAKENDYLLFYDAKKNLLPITGQIKTLTEGEENKKPIVTLNIALDDGPDAGVGDIAFAEIVIDHLKDAQRLPLTALVHHTDESAHVWEAIQENDGSRIVKLRTLTKEPLTINDFFVLESGEYTSNVYILNPDEKLQEGQSIAVTNVLYQAPRVADPERIADEKTDWVFKLPEKEQPGGEGCSSTCGGTTGATGAADFIEKIKALARKQADSTP